MGILGRDPDSLKSYVAIASDTRGIEIKSLSDLIEPPKPYEVNFDRRNIVIPQGANYIFGLLDEQLKDIYFKIVDPSTDIWAFKSAYPGNFDEILRLAQAYNKLARLEPPFEEYEGENREFELNLFDGLRRGSSSIVSEINGLPRYRNNSFLFGINDGNEREMYVVSPNGTSYRITFTAFGSASQLALEVLVNKLGNDAASEKIISIPNALDILTEALAYAQRDINTAGADLALLTENGPVSFRKNYLPGFIELRKRHQEEVEIFLRRQTPEI